MVLMVSLAVLALLVLIGAVAPQRLASTMHTLPDRTIAYAGQTD
ncbi:MAG TPA: hypothetical protein VFG73_06990 [Rhodanobacteraceae bacterium]|nr:hypothetical protein [Rhodanobacteraceae bacterium]